MTTAENQPKPKTHKFRSQLLKHRQSLNAPDAYEPAKLAHAKYATACAAYP